MAVCRQRRDCVWAVVGSHTLPQTESKCSLLIQEVVYHCCVQAGHRQFGDGKKTGKGKKSAQVEAGRPEESGGTDTERRKDATAKRTVILTDTQEAGGSGR